jgi:hypothetical protein
VCVHGRILEPVLADDHDTHVQVVVDEPLPYPKTTISYYVFGGATENSPPYKDPSRPGGALVDPRAKQDVLLLGTYRYDDGHGWFELHPLKAVWPAP